MVEYVKDGERLDELHRNGYFLIQNPKKFCFGMDAVLLSGFVRVKKTETVLDMGTGTGVIPILLEGKTEGRHFTGLEIQRDMADMAQRSVMLNKLSEKISIVAGDIKEASALFGRSSFDVVTCNPPYMNENHGLKNPEEPKAIARHEVKCSFEDIARESGAVLKPGGRFLYGTPSSQAVGIAGNHEEIPAGTQKDEIRPSFCRRGGQYGIDRGFPGRQAADAGRGSLNCL